MLSTWKHIFLLFILSLPFSVSGGIDGWGDEWVDEGLRCRLGDGIALLCVRLTYWGLDEIERMLCFVLCSDVLRYLG